MSQPADFADGPLVGVRVIDLSRVIAGPYVGRILTDLGASVIKVEPPAGDPARQIAPRHDRGMSGFLAFANVGKRSVSIDLSKPGASALLLDLVRTADAVIENFRPGVMDRLGIGWDAIHAANPRAILLSINGYGADSAWAGRRAYAPIMHAVTGILHDQSRYSGQPVAQRNEAHADTLSALHGVVSILAALRVAEASGEGQHVEVPMFDAVLSTYSEVVYELLDGPDDRVMNPIYDAGPLGAIASAGSAAYVWTLAARAFPDELPEPTPPGADLPTKARLRHEALEHWMASQPSHDALFAKLDEAGLACAAVVPLRDALSGPLARERDLLTEVDDRRGGVRPVVRAPARFSNTRNEIRGVPPRRGEHNAEVLGELLGYDAARVAALESAGVLVPPSADED